MVGDPVADAARAESSVSAPHRAVFVDVENSSRPDHVAAMLDHLDVGRPGRELALFAVGNWRVVGHETARLLAERGAVLVHSAPAFGVKDWSDLRIAVDAGAWLGRASPGDRLDIITDDQAFDAVGDVAASMGIHFRRLSYRALIRSGDLPSPVPRARRPRGVRRVRRAT
jgi:hypothetical protein